MPAVRLSPIVAVLAAGSLSAGCGAGAADTSTTGRSQSSAKPGSAGPPAPGPGSGAKPLPTPGPTGRPADPAAVKVIRAWSSALRRGDVRGAAAYFALPSLIANGSGASGVAVITIHTRAQADAANATLPCGAQFIRADQRGRYVNVLFRLTNRSGPGGGCSSGVGQTARTNFVIVGGRIVEWIRAPEDPGDNRSPAQPAPAPPSTRQPSGPVI